LSGASSFDTASPAWRLAACGLAVAAAFLVSLLQGNHHEKIAIFAGLATTLGVLPAAHAQSSVNLYG